jgi:hypothetical protein
MTPSQSIIAVSEPSLLSKKFWTSYSGCVKTNCALAVLDMASIMSFLSQRRFAAGERGKNPFRVRGEVALDW